MTFNAVGGGLPSSLSEAILAAIPPSEPTNLSKVSSTRNQIVISWAAPADDGGSSITAYKIYGNSGGSDTNFEELAEVSESTFTYVRSGLSPPGETFKFKVAAVNVIDSGSQTNELAIIAASAPAKPVAPTKATASLSSISIEWQEPDDGGSTLLNYILKMNEGTGSSTFNIIDASVPAGDISYTRSGLTTGEDYQFVLIAVNAVGSSDESNASDDIRAALKPDAPGDPFYSTSSQTTMQFGYTSPVDAGRSNGGTDLLGYII